MVYSNSITTVVTISLFDLSDKMITFTDSLI